MRSGENAREAHSIRSASHFPRSPSSAVVPAANSHANTDLGCSCWQQTHQRQFLISEPPEWISTWLAKRAAASKRKETQESPNATSSPTATATQRKTAEKRLAQVNKGIELLDLWLNDLVRNGLGNLETQPATFWEK